MHIITTDQFDPDNLSELFVKADQFRRLDSDAEGRQTLLAMHPGRQMCSLFYEPSTRTRLSFETAAIKMGIGLVSTENAREFSSASKGESIEDTIRVLDQYNYDVVVMRHHETGAAFRAAVASKTPIINAGDGKGEHPTQALLDVYTIQKEFGRVNGLKVVMGGDLKHGRTVRSLAQLLAKFREMEVVFVSVKELQMGNDVKKVLDKNGVKYTETDDIKKAFKNADVVYWTRQQNERIDDLSKIPKKCLQINSGNVDLLPEHAIIMHPLPRVDEIAVEIDSNPRARYFEQAGNGLYVRMALLDMILSQKTKAAIRSFSASTFAHST